jgi:hypothetical protein
VTRWLKSHLCEKSAFIKVLEQYTFHPLVKITAESEADRACAADFDEEEAQLPFQSPNVQEQPRWQNGTKRLLFQSGSVSDYNVNFYKAADCRKILVEGKIEEANKSVPQGMTAKQPESSSLVSC